MLTYYFRSSPFRHNLGCDNIEKSSQIVLLQYFFLVENILYRIALLIFMQYFHENEYFFLNYSILEYPPIYSKSFLDLMGYALFTYLYKAVIMLRANLDHLYLQQ